MHKCKEALPEDIHGSAIDECNEHEDGTLWVDNGEYASQVNYCPFCGYKAIKQVELKNALRAN